MSGKNFQDIFDEIDAWPWWKHKYYDVRRNLLKIPYIPKIVKYKLEHIHQRITKGYSYQDVWGLHYYLTEVIVGGIRDLKKMNHGYPMGLSEIEWNEILDRIANGIELHQQLIDEWKDPTPQQELMIDDAWNLLRYWYGSLWD